MPQQTPHWIACAIASLFAVSPILAADTAAEPKRFSPEELRADLAEMYQKLQESHFDLYARRPKNEYDAFFQQTLANLDRPHTLFEAEVAFQKFAAYGRVAHSRVDFPSAAFAAFREAGGRILPLFIQVENGRIYIRENSGPAAIESGDEWLTLDGEPMTRWLARVGAHVSADNDYLATTQLEPRFPALLWLEVGEKAKFRVQLRRGSGLPFELEIAALSRAEMQKAAAERATSGRPAPFELDWEKREARVLPGGIAYLRPGPFYNNLEGATNLWDVGPFRQFLDQAFADFKKADARVLLVDLRRNPGGDDSFSNPMIAYFATRPFRFTSDFRIRVSEAATNSNRRRLELGNDDPGSTSNRLAAAYAASRNGELVSFEIPETPPRPEGRFAGPVYLLVDRHSYSNTVSVAAIVQDYGFGKILGEETADLATTYGAMEQFRLSRTGIEVGFPKALILRPNGDHAARGVLPDLPIVQDPPFAPEDRVLGKAIALIEATHPAAPR